MQGIRITVNDEEYESNVEPRTHLADYLREDLRLTGTHLACEHGICGACTVLIDGQTARSCLTLAIACNGRHVRTIEGFRDDEIMNKLRENFNKEHALQCGFCTPGMLITARDVVLRSHEENEEQVRVEMSGNLCRCTGYRGIIKAISNVISEKIHVRLEPLPSKSDLVSVEQEVFKPFTPVGSDQINPSDEGEKVTNGSDLDSQIIEEIIIKHNISRVWETFNDIPTIVNCLPGASITEYCDKILKGKVIAKLGPIKVEFIGSASMDLDNIAHSGVVSGKGVDNFSGTRARGTINYQMYDHGKDNTRVVLSMNYNLQGPLSQYSRSGLIVAFIKSIIKEFSENLTEILSGNNTYHNESIPNTKIFLGRLAWNLFVKFLKNKLLTKTRENR